MSKKECSAVLVTDSIILPLRGFLSDGLKNMLQDCSRLKELDKRAEIYFNIDLSSIKSFMYVKYENLNDLTIDICISHAIKFMTADEISVIVKYMYDYIDLSKPAIVEKLKEHVNNTANDTYTWNKLSLQMEYSFYQFSKRNWPVKKENNLNWQIVAKKIGLVDKIYPGEAFKQPLDKRLTMEKKEVCEDSDDDLESIGLTHILNEKIRHIKREEKLLKLKSDTNYGVYGINYKKDDIEKNKTEIVNICDSFIKLEQDRCAILFISKLMVSKNDYHLVIKNPCIIDKIKYYMELNPRLSMFIKYIMSYSFYMMQKEERMLGKRIDSTNRSIWTEEEFRALPIFDSELDKSPYFTEIYTDKNEPLEDLILMYLGGERRFTTAIEFNKRLSIMSGNMLDGIDLSEQDAFLTGSSLVPCVATNPLERKYRNSKNPFVDFVERYYPSYFSIQNYVEENEINMKNIKRILDNFTGHCEFIIPEEYNEIENSQDMLHYLYEMKETNKIPHILDNAITDFAGKFDEFLKMEKNISDLDVAVMSLSTKDYNKKVFDIFAKIKINLMKNGKAGNIYLYKQPVKYGFKWVLKGPDAIRPIDFFKISVPAHVLLYRFHLNIVRFWWDGKKVRGLSSAISAALTGVNQWYRWFSNNKDPMDIVLKNMERGYTTLLNKKEIDTIKSYIKEVDKYKKLRDIFKTGKVGIYNQMFGDSGGIQSLLPKQEQLAIYDNTLNYWETENLYLKRLGCSLCTKKNGKKIPPKIYAFDSIIDDFFD